MLHAFAAIPQDDCMNVMAQLTLSPLLGSKNKRAITREDQICLARILHWMYVACKCLFILIMMCQLLCLGGQA